MSQHPIMTATSLSSRALAGHDLQTSWAAQHSIAVPLLLGGTVGEMDGVLMAISPTNNMQYRSMHMTYKT